MNTIGWPLLEFTSRLLDHEEREVVLGDLLETNQNAWRGMLDIFGLAFRRQADLWRDYRPWLAGLAVAFPSSYLLMTASLSVSLTYQRLINHKVFAGHWPTGHEGFLLLLCHIFLLIAWSWSSGCLVGSVSRRTVWVSAALSALPSLCFLCIALPKLCLFLFLPPAIFGVRWGWQRARISFRAASVLALTMTVLMISAWSNNALWILNWALLFPAWYLVAEAWRSGPKGPNWLLDHGRCRNVSLR
jgi:hypothetical protein